MLEESLASPLQDPAAQTTQIKSFFVPAQDIRALQEHKSEAYLATYNKTPTRMCWPFLSFQYGADNLNKEMPCNNQELFLMTWEGKEEKKKKKISGAPGLALFYGKNFGETHSAVFMNHWNLNKRYMKVKHNIYIYLPHIFNIHSKRAFMGNKTSS